MGTKQYLVIGILLAGGILAGVYLRGYSDIQGWTTAS